MIPTILACLAGLLLGGGLVWLWRGGKSAQTAALQAQLSDRDQALQAGRDETEQLRQELQQSRVAQAKLETQAETDKEKLSWLEQAEKQIRELSDKVLSEQREAMTQKGKETLNDTLKPFSEQMKDFRNRMDALNQNTTKERTELQSMVKSLSEQTVQVSSEAHELTQALKGDSQMRGEWGEIALQRVLEMSGLTEGREYETQKHYSTAADEDEGSRRQRPDVIVRLPAERDIVIDAKLTLNSWIEASRAEFGTGEAARRSATAEFINAVRLQVKNLSGKQYQDLPEIRTLDFTFMYIPIEPAYTCVLQEAPDLVSEAFKQQVALVSPTTLLPVLRIVENIWRLERQSQNSQEIAEEAGKMYDKFVLFVDSMAKVGKGLEGAQSNYDTAFKQLKTGKGNLIGRAERIKALGVDTRKQMPADPTEGMLPDDSEQ